MLNPRKARRIVVVFMTSLLLDRNRDKLPRQIQEQNVGPSQVTRAFGWLKALGWGMGKESDGLGTFFGVVVESDVE